tara:strand:+ start:56 stop:196 length:141 start_codon:yes stop_codon:yes gene_type:complete
VNLDDDEEYNQEDPLEADANADYQHILHSNVIDDFSVFVVSDCESE